MILAATCELLLANGYRRLTMEAVAARSGVAKPALYRRWSSKADLVAAAVVANLAIDAPAEVVALPDGGEIGHDLHAWLDAFASVATDPRNAALALALIAAAAENPADAQALYGLLTGPSHQALTARLRAAAAAGQIRPDADLDAIGDALIGSIVIQLLTGRAATTRQHAHELLEIVLRGLRPDIDQRRSTQPN
ncbi:TetR/AcrR family transcriptional regulator [Sphaerisporangium perillae]|uniref:TetR/AcrR family transcriptional regulator n=1 Tax=Sphaerisporangium perillae TaxID=2935860 RepID=UPI00201067A8|nr:TetR/AcrR family transcriptional regulator [Sphaerisporangium perillae]